MNNINAFDLTVSALRDKGLSSDEILKVLSELSGWTSEVSVSQETPVEESAPQLLTDLQKENKIRDLLLEIGVPRHIKGYHYIIKAIMLYEKEPDQPMTKCLYPAVAKEFKTTASRVERAIRHAIECAWNRCDFGVMDRLFGNTISCSNGKPTNSEFIAMCAEWIARM